MQAIQFSKYGAPSVLQLTDVPKPAPMADHLLVRVEAAGVNPVDARIRAGKLKFLMPGKLPIIPGADFTGVVEAHGPNAGKEFAVGQPVLGMKPVLQHVGTYAEYVVVHKKHLVARLDTLPVAQAAGLPLAGLTALQALRGLAVVAKGQRVLINGAAGGVGHLAIQIAKALGAEVIAVASAKNLDFCKQMGADHVLDYRAKDFSLTEKNLDVVFDVAATSSYGIVKSALTKTGTYITTEPSPNAFFNQLLTGIFSPQTTRVIMVRPDAGDLQFLLRLHAAGQLQVHIQQTYPLAQASQAHTQIETGHTLGKLVLSVG